MNRFIDNGDNTITDTQTNLTWTKLTLAVGVTQGGAKEFVAAHGQGFRLPSVTELFGLVDHSKHGPAVNTEFFPDIRNDYYWTDTPTAWNSSAVWCVNFYYGGVSNGVRSYRACVLAVRSSQ